MNDRDKLHLIKTMHSKCSDYFIKTYMDPENVNHLDWKIEVLQALQDGKTPPEIEHYDDVQDLYPAQEEAINLDYTLD